MALMEEVLRGDFLAVSRAISKVEEGGGEGQRLLEGLSSKVGRALRLGITGPPGVGKSTAIDEMAGVLCTRGDKVGILAVDPSSPFSGGALLGDRVRMSRSSEREGVFIRSMATRGAGGGLARATQDAADILDAAGCTVLLVETVGVGQCEIEISRATDCTLVFLSPESGDGIQAMKSGLLEVADVLVINKADRPGADRLEFALKGAFELVPRARRDVPLLLAEASAGRGIPELVAVVDRWAAAHRADGTFEERRRRNLENRIKQIAAHLLYERLWPGNGTGIRVQAAVDQVLRDGRSPYRAAQDLIGGTLR